MLKIDFIRFRDGSVSVYLDHKLIGAFETPSATLNFSKAKAFALGYLRAKTDQWFSEEDVAKLPVDDCRPVEAEAA